MKQKRAQVAVVGLFFVLFRQQEAEAYDRYDPGCSDCHGGFLDDSYSPPAGGDDWPGSLHDVMGGGGGFMATTCALCHSEGDGGSPSLGTSEGTASTAGAGCNGCHGRQYGGEALAVGLRLHHDAVLGETCDSCHGDDPTPLPESSSPSYYGSPDTAVDVPCNDDEDLSEDWSGDGEGLDNDGDLLFDGADPDCGGSSLGCGDGVIGSGETCDPPESCPTSCDDGDSCTVDGMTGTAASCDATCDSSPIQTCTDGDGCCPVGCDPAFDGDCPWDREPWSPACAAAQGGRRAAPGLTIMALLAGLLALARGASRA